MIVEHHKHCKPRPMFKIAQSVNPLLHPFPLRMAQVLPSCCELDEQKRAPSEVKPTISILNSSSAHGTTKCNTKI